MADDTGLKLDGPNEQFEVCDDFSTDLVSVPSVVAWFIPRAGRYARAAVLHDYLLRYPERVGIDSREADRRFRLQMQRDGVSLLRRWIMWAAVRSASILRARVAQAGGKMPWPQCRYSCSSRCSIVLLPVITIAISTFVFWLLESFTALVVPDEAPVPLQPQDVTATRRAARRWWCADGRGGRCPRRSPSAPRRTWPSRTRSRPSGRWSPPSACRRGRSRRR